MRNRIALSGFIITVFGLFLFAPGLTPIAEAGFTPTPEPTGTTVPPTSTPVVQPTETAVPPTATAVPVTNTPTSNPPTSTPVTSANTPVPQPTATNTLIPAPTNTPSGNQPAASTSTPAPTKVSGVAKEPTPTQVIPTPVPRAVAPSNPPVAPALGEGFSMSFLIGLNVVLALILIGLFYAWRSVSKPVAEPKNKKQDLNRK